jgi:hypothetical protein
MESASSLYAAWETPCPGLSIVLLPPTRHKQHNGRSPNEGSLPWLSTDTIELYERNMIDELALSSCTGSYR